MKKYLLGILFFSIVACGSSDDLDNQPPNNDPPLGKIKTLTIKDEEQVNGVVSMIEKLDFKFEYDNDKLVKVWDINGNYTENLSYTNGLLTSISIEGNTYPGLSDASPFSEKRKLIYDNNQRLIKVENIDVNYVKNYKTFEYPSGDIIIVKNYINNYSGIPFNTDMLKIYMNNKNVTKVERYEEGNLSKLGNVITYEYDNNINPDFLIDRNRILALPEYAYNIFMLQDYSQISRNNISEKVVYYFGSLPDSPKKEIKMVSQYQNSDLPFTIYYQEKIDNTPNDYVRVSAVYGY
ncbi:hypothetical protein WH221_16985 [Chryseobacterium culicis]|uniref:DUF4595 domain-containing protein n=1 Tax=Chryseobacterium culicis TaxID=680127 RepID=A0A2S9CPG1_CHRCI|nr:hypothetical protein [Chryseobacterium culicis]PRB82381.1 hypothetical protein CQ022_16940 [Chryseobacterium culicis]PRB88756.1 hypothetical protein CQ033_15835 [Chryseobacterium culicis]